MKNSSHILLLTFLFTLISCNTDSDEEILGEWIAASITYENGETVVPEAEYILTFENLSQYRIQLDVNLCSGEVSFNNNSVEFPGGIGCTEVCCDSSFAVSLTEILPQTEQWQITGNQLSFSRDAGLRLTFSKK